MMGVIKRVGYDGKFLLFAGHACKLVGTQDNYVLVSLVQAPETVKNKTFRLHKDDIVWDSPWDTGSGISL